MSKIAHMAVVALGSLAAVVAGAGFWLMTSGTAEAASGGVSDGSLIIAIFLPIIFVGAFLAVIIWGLSARVVPGDSKSDVAMPWWRTATWYRRRDEPSD